MKYFELNTGASIPALGLGTYQLTPEEAENAVYHALKDGYRLIDTANAYVNEKAVGRGIKRSGVPREEIFLETKLWPTVYEDERAVDKTLERLNTDYIDLLLLHQPGGNFMRGYELMEQAVKAGKVRAIGLSNFSPRQINNILARAEVKPSVVQLETHPYFPRKEQAALLKQNGILLQSWYPLGHGDKTLMEQPVFRLLGEKYGKTAVQIILRWHIQMGYIVIPGSKNPAHIQDNFDVFDFELSATDMAEIQKIDRGEPYFAMPDVDPDPTQPFPWVIEFENQE